MHHVSLGVTEVVESGEATSQATVKAARYFRAAAVGGETKTSEAERIIEGRERRARWVPRGSRGLLVAKKTTKSVRKKVMAMMTKANEADWRWRVARGARTIQRPVVAGCS